MARGVLVEGLKNEKMTIHVTDGASDGGLGAPGPLETRRNSFDRLVLRIEMDQDESSKVVIL